MSFGQYSAAETAGRRLTQEDKRRHAPVIVPAVVSGEPGKGAYLATVKNMGHNRALLTYKVVDRRLNETPRLRAERRAAT